VGIAKLVIGSSEKNADMLYAAGIFVPDPFVAVMIGNKWYGLLNKLEVDRARKTSKFDEVLIDTPYREAAKNKNRKGLGAIAGEFLKSKAVSRVEISRDLGISTVKELEWYGIEYEFEDGGIFPERQIKKEIEIEYLAEAERLTMQSMIIVEDYLGNLNIDKSGFLTDDRGLFVKAEDARRAIETFLIGNGAMPAHTIVACGEQGSDPHNIGRGRLKANEPIIVDIFPRVLKTGYWGDMTRTFVKGKASAEVRKLHQTVKEGQEIGLNMVAAGVNGQDIHKAINDHFNKQGYQTKEVNGKQTGFFHSTGHGVGLDIHEAPGVGGDHVLQAGEVITIEPGLYYPGLGGVRLEDMVTVRDGGCDNLTNYKKELEID